MFQIWDVLIGQQFYCRQPWMQIYKGLARAPSNIKDGKLCNNNKQPKAVNYCYEALHFRCLWGFLATPLVYDIKMCSQRKYRHGNIRNIFEFKFMPYFLGQSTFKTLEHYLTLNTTNTSFVRWFQGIIDVNNSSDGFSEIALLLISG